MLFNFVNMLNSKNNDVGSVYLLTLFNELCGVIGQRLPILHVFLTSYNNSTKFKLNFLICIISYKQRCKNTEFNFSVV